MGPGRIRMSLQENGPTIAVVGVTGAVGQEFLYILSYRDFPYRSIKMLASKGSAGHRLTFEDKEYVEEELTVKSFNGVDIALFSAGGSISKEFVPILVDRGTIVVDNSSAFRIDEKVPPLFCLMAATPLQIREVLEGKAPTCKIFKRLYAFNIFSHNASILSNGYNEEEMKMVKETRLKSAMQMIHMLEGLALNFGRDSHL